jgi:hypothetical protein
VALSSASACAWGELQYQHPCVCGVAQSSLPPPPPAHFEPGGLAHDRCVRESVHLCAACALPPGGVRALVGELDARWPGESECARLRRTSAKHLASARRMPQAAETATSPHPWIVGEHCPEEQRPGVVAGAFAYPTCHFRHVTHFAYHVGKYQPPSHRWPVLRAGAGVVGASKFNLFPATCSLLP